MKGKILVTGSLGQIGTELVPALKKIHGEDNVVGLDIKVPPKDYGLFEDCNTTEIDVLRKILQKHNIKIIYHLCSLLSASGERYPWKAWHVNMDSLKNVLDLAVELKIEKIFWPSSIAVFGPNTPKNNTPQHTRMEPTTMYGVTKVSGELLCNYYHTKYGLDIRSLRYPGLISYKTPPGGGTTDYAVKIFHDAVQHKKYKCFVTKDTTLPMMYMDDAIRGTLELMNAPSDKIKIRTSYNISALSFSVEELVLEIKKEIGDLEVIYEPDGRQDIANSWPKIISDSSAREDWGWKHEFDLEKLSKTMLKNIQK